MTPRAASPAGSPWNSLSFGLLGFQEVLLTAKWLTMVADRVGLLCENVEILQSRRKDHASRG
jgi:hypothetical protein